jgi:hypothetical protein
VDPRTLDEARGIFRAAGRQAGPEATRPLENIHAHIDRGSSAKDDGTVIARSRDVVLRLASAFAATAAVLACGRSTVPSVAPSHTTGAQAPAPRFALGAAIDVPAAAAPAVAIVSCRGDVYCREDTVATTATDREPEALEDARADCARRGGETGTSACPRAGVVATCSLGSETGTIQVFTYAAGAAVGTMSERCEDLGGSFELAAR